MPEGNKQLKMLRLMKMIVYEKLLRYFGLLFMILIAYDFDCF